MPELVCAADDPRWHDERRQGITATDIVTIIGLSSHDSPYSLFWRKRGEIGEPADTDRWRLGRQLEPYVAGRWAQEHGRALIPGALYRSRGRPWQLATLDARTADIGEPVECKSWADADRHAWDGAPPPAVRAQVLWQMDVMDVNAGHVGVVFLPSGEFRSYVISHHEMCMWRDYPDGGGLVPGKCAVCADLTMMRAAGEEFGRRVRGELPPPDVDGSAATLAAVRARFPAPVRGKAVSIDRELWIEYLACKRARDDYEAAMRYHEAEIRERLGEATEIEVDDEVVARRIISDPPVKAHVRHMDYIRRTGRQGEG